MLKINTIYPAFMGEVNCHGIGAPCTFVRLSGCNLRCYLSTKKMLCDTPEALEMKCGKSMSEDEIAQIVHDYKRKVVCLTGGEPLLQDVKHLLEKLTRMGHEVVIETNGSVSVRPYRGIKNVSFVIDRKGPSTGEQNKMIEENYGLLNEDDYVKLVIDNGVDFREFYEWWQKVYKDHHTYNIALGTFWGSQITYDELTKRIMELDPKIYLNMQTHKMACMYDKYKGNSDFSELFIPKEI